ncbi:hypothetical protein LZ31DRAFT_589984 [Colletotrichum somersetense]|nr:hypothetical protein LZ31DRAFT_589984 [Colletotrichum somersetense]
MKTKPRASSPVEVINPLLKPPPKISRKYEWALRRLLYAKIGGVSEADKPLIQSIMPAIIRAANDPLMPDPNRFYQDPDYVPDYNSLLRLVQQLRAWYGGLPTF